MNNIKKDVLSKIIILWACIELLLGFSINIGEKNALWVFYQLKQLSTSDYKLQTLDLYLLIYAIIVIIVSILSFLFLIFTFIKAFKYSKNSFKKIPTNGLIINIFFMSILIILSICFLILNIDFHKGKISYYSSECYGLFLKMLFKLVLVLAVELVLFNDKKQNQCVTNTQKGKMINLSNANNNQIENTDGIYHETQNANKNNNTSTQNLLDELENLVDLDIITQEEYEQKKKEILQK